VLTILAAITGGILTALAAGLRIRRLQNTITGLNARLAAARHLNDHDPLTGLLNRTAAERHFIRELAEDRPVTVALIDLDDFKAVNDEYGYSVGDDLIRAVAHRLDDGAHRFDGAAARFGGDEFLLLLPDPDGFAPTLEHIAAPVTVHTDDGQAILYPGASAGVAAHDDLATETFAELLHRADIALHHAKQHRGDVRRYEPEMRMPRTVGRHGPRRRDRHHTEPRPS
jgi:diguanylate cyclase (GGDEF)-like protein